MSSARKRRAELNANPPPPGTPKLVPSFPSGTSSAGAAGAGTNSRMTPSPQMTLQQIINITDRRLVVLENFMNDSKTRFESVVGSAAPVVGATQDNSDVLNAVSTLQENLSELYSRFDIVVGEVAELKDTLTKLQTYTLEVNHILMQEKFREQDEVEIPSTDDIHPAEEEEEDESPTPMSQPPVAPKGAGRRRGTKVPL